MGKSVSLVRSVSLLAALCWNGAQGVGYGMGFSSIGSGVANCESGPMSGGATFCPRGVTKMTVSASSYEYQTCYSPGRPDDDEAMG